MKYTLLILGYLSISSMVHAQSPDKCHVYLIDLEAAKKVQEKLEKTGSLTPEEIAKPTKILGSFTPKIGEEELTTEHFRFPSSKAIVTASVYYTDESMALKKKGDKIINDVSIMLGIVISKKEEDNAISAENNALAESTYNKETIGVRAKSYITIDGRKYMVGLECHCNESQPPEAK
jgi:hypothetical protein